MRRTLGNAVVFGWSFCDRGMCCSLRKATRRLRVVRVALRNGGRGDSSLSLFLLELCVFKAAVIGSEIKIVYFLIFFVAC